MRHQHERSLGTMFFSPSIVVTRLSKSKFYVSLNIHLKVLRVLQILHQLYTHSLRTY